MKKLTVNLKKFLDMGDEFSPHYQFSHPVEFQAKTEWYMEHYYNPATPERYMDKMKHAVIYANKSIMLDKLGVDAASDPEEVSPELFKSVFLDLAKAESVLEVNGESVLFGTALMKSFEATEPANDLYERMWKQAFDTILSNPRI